jgi:hypothetical protein
LADSHKAGPKRLMLRFVSLIHIGRIRQERSGANFSNYS